MEERRPGGRNTEVNDLRQRIQERSQRLYNYSPTSTNSGDTPPSQSSRSGAVTASRGDVHNSYLHRHRLRRQREEDTPGTVQDAVDRLNAITTNLTSLLDQPLPQIVTADEWMMGMLEDTNGYSSRSKRRKLDHDPLDAEPLPVYGHYGQVVPGKLKMSMLSCDGGYLTERGQETIHNNYWPENVLRNDKSVYCTERHRCNILLSHAKETQFSVTKIVIKAPESGFTAPVQEGLVFIAMNSEGLLTRTNRYRVRSSPPPSLTSHASVYPDSNGQHAQISRPNYRTPRQGEYSYVYSVERPPSRRHNFPAAQVIIPMVPYDPVVHQYPPRAEVRPSDRDNEDGSSDSHVSLDLALLPGYSVTTTCDEPSGDEEDPSSAAVMYDLQQRQRNIGHDYFSSDDEEIDYRRHRRMRSFPRKIELEEADEDESRVPGSEALLPHARFFIQNKRNAVSIKFDPPIAGKYVLLKLWSPHGERDNIDIQNVSVYGFAGPRFIPAIKFK
jgi:hypothetical protein